MHDAEMLEGIRQKYIALSPVMDERTWDSQSPGASALIDTKAVRTRARRAYRRARQK